MSLFRKTRFLCAGPRLALTLTLLLGAAGCGGVYQPSRHASFQLDPAQEINDDDVRKAFEAKPQLPATFSLAYYSFDEQRIADIEALLKGVKGVRSIYRIPPLLITSKRRFQQSNPWDPPDEVSVKQLRLLAARARADLLVIVDAGYRTGSINGLMGLNLLILPIFFSPFLDNQVESYLDLYVIDTRNGYLYGHLSEDEQGGPEYATIYAEDASLLRRRQWQSLRAKAKARLAELIEEEQQLSQGLSDSHIAGPAEAPAAKPAPCEPAPAPEPDPAPTEAPAAPPEPAPET